MLNKYECVITSYSVLQPGVPVVTITRHWWLWTAKWQRVGSLTAPAIGLEIVHTVRIRRVGEP